MSATTFTGGWDVRMPEDCTVASKQWTETQTIEAFSEHLKSNSWCIDISANQPRMLNGSINQVACADEIGFQFRDWLSQEKRPICGIDADFLKNLERRTAERLPRVYGTSFRPTNEATFLSRGALMANTYRPPTVVGQPCPEGLAKLDLLAARVFPDPTERKHCLQFFAHILRHPEIRPQWGLLITGAGGTGKSMLIRLVAKAMGNRYSWHENDYSAAFEKFSEVFPNNLLVVFDDAPTGARTYEQLKHAVTSEFQEVQSKQQQIRRLRESYSRVVVVSNEEQPFTWSDDRRFLAPRYCVHKVSKDESVDFFRDLADFMKMPDCAATVNSWLANVDPSDFDVSTPFITDTHRSMSSLACSEVDELVEAYVADERIVHLDEVARHIVSRGNRQPTPSIVERALTRANYVGRRRTHPCGSGQVTLWSPARYKRSRSVTALEVERMVAAGAFR